MSFEQPLFEILFERVSDANPFERADFIQASGGIIAEPEPGVWVSHPGSALEAANDVIAEGEGFRNWNPREESAEVYMQLLLMDSNSMLQSINELENALNTMTFHPGKEAEMRGLVRELAQRKAAIESVIAQIENGTIYNPMSAQTRMDLAQARAGQTAADIQSTLGRVV